MGKAEARQIALWITEALEGWQNPEALASVRQRVQALTASFPVPGL
jgi:glycine/serine hydroxymethyltransferase